MTMYWSAAVRLHRAPGVQTMLQTMLSRRWFSALPEKETPVKNMMVDTLEVMKRFEQVGLSRDQAEAMTKHVTRLILGNKDQLEQEFVSRTVLDRLMVEQESRIGSFKAELQKAADGHSASVHKDLERQQGFLEKMRSEIRHEIDKLAASQRLDLNLEKGRMRDELQTIRDKTTDLTIKMDQYVNELKAAIEQSKNDAMKWTMTIVGSLSAVVFTITRLLQPQ